jgi:hypothetical protein
MASGGYTFKEAGAYQVQARLRLSKSRVLVSNVESLDVRPARPHSSRFAEFRDALLRPAAARVLYHRPPYPAASAVRRPEEFAAAKAKLLSA